MRMQIDLANDERENNDGEPKNDDDDEGIILETMTKKGNEIKKPIAFSKDTVFSSPTSLKIDNVSSPFSPFFTPRMNTKHWKRNSEPLQQLSMNTPIRNNSPKFDGTENRSSLSNPRNVNLIKPLSCQKNNIFEVPALNVKVNTELLKVLQHPNFLRKTAKIDKYISNRCEIVQESATEEIVSILKDTSKLGIMNKRNRKKTSKKSRCVDEKNNQNYFDIDNSITENSSIKCIENESKVKNKRNKSVNITSEENKVKVFMLVDGDDLSSKDDVYEAEIVSSSDDEESSSDCSTDTDNEFSSDGDSFAKFDVQLDSSYEANVISEKKDTRINHVGQSFSTQHNENLERRSQRNTVTKGKWTLGSQIGIGSFGVVHIGMNGCNGNLMAVKSLNIPSSSSIKMIKNIQREIDVMRDLHHPNIVRYFGAEIDRNMFHIFQEWVPGGSVASLLEKFGPFPLAVVKNYLYQIILGLSYLHSNRILHRDIKGCNVLVSDRGIVKLADFGSSKRIHVNQNGIRLEMEDMMENMTMRGTPFYMAIEVFEERYGEKADIWSCGCVAYQMFTGQVPWTNLDIKGPISLYKYLKEHDGPPPIHITKNDESATDEVGISLQSSRFAFENILNQCFYRDPHKRPSARNLLDDSFFKCDLNDSIIDDESTCLPISPLVINDEVNRHVEYHTHGKISKQSNIPFHSPCAMLPTLAFPLSPLMLNYEVKKKTECYAHNNMHKHSDIASYSECVMSPKLTEEKKDVTKTAAENNNKILVISCNTNEWPKWAIDVKEHITHNAIYKHSDISSNSLFPMPPKLTEKRGENTKTRVENDNKKLATNCNANEWPKRAIDVKENITDNDYKYDDIPSDSLFRMPRKLAEEKEDRTKWYVKKNNKRLANNCNSSKWPRWAVNLKESIAQDKLYKHGDIPSNSFFPMPRKLVKRKDRTKTNVEERNKKETKKLHEYLRTYFKGLKVSSKS